MELIRDGSAVPEVFFSAPGSADGADTDGSLRRLVEYLMTDTDQVRIESTTPTTTQTTTACAARVADLVFMFDLAVYLNETLCPVTGPMRARCPSTSSKALTCVAYDFAVSFLDTISDDVGYDGVRVAAVAYGADSQNAQLLFGGRFLTDVDEIKQGLKDLDTINVEPGHGKAQEAFVQMNRDLLRHSQGLREFDAAVPLIVVALTDASNKDIGTYADELKGRTALAGAKRIMFTYEQNVRAATPTVYELFSTVDASVNPNPSPKVQLSCEARQACTGGAAPDENAALCLLGSVQLCDGADAANAEFRKSCPVLCGVCRHRAFGGLNQAANDAMYRELPDTECFTTQTSTEVSFSFHAPMCPGTEPAPTPRAALVTEPASKAAFSQNERNIAEKALSRPLG